jgi:energy-coupling factor transport system ATP-binding protein
MQAVTVTSLTYQYYPGGNLILNDISFQIKQGEFVAITGLSGCGKSTLCHCLSGTIRHQRDGVMTGNVLINGKNIQVMNGAKMALEAGMVFQDPDTQLFSPTVEDEIAFAPENLCLPPDEIRARVDKVMSLLGIGNLRYMNPCELSGGEKHLVALAAVLALDPPILILDEVMSQLDHAGKKLVLTALETLRKLGKTIIAVEHNLEVLASSDRLMVMEDGKLLRFDRTETLLADHDFLAAKRLI